MTIESWRTSYLLWGKTTDGDGYHPLPLHLLDVAAVARAFLVHHDGDHTVRALSRLLGVGPSYVPSVVPFLVAMHDIGKASPSFQGKSESGWRRLSHTGLTDGIPWMIDRFRHDQEATCVLGHLLAASGVLQLSGSKREQIRTYNGLALGLGGHHGLYYGTSDPKYPEIPTKDNPRESWQAIWREARQNIVESMRNAILDDIALPVACNPENLSALTVALCGFTILCDWIGSERIPDDIHPDPQEYFSQAVAWANTVVNERELLGYLPTSDADPVFSTMFRQITPRPLQLSVDPGMLPELPEQSLVIVEAPMGEGKTEAALLLAMRLAHRRTCRGFYFALPTMATSNQMAKRVETFLRDQLPPGERASLLLVHAHATMTDLMHRLLASATADTLLPEDSVVAASWLLPRKRCLLSPYGVGTVDQAMMAALNVKHGALRLFGLTGKVVIVDEIHAYDLYMSTIIDRLLEWLRSLGASVVLLSATLPRARRYELIAAYTGLTESELKQNDNPDPYPLVTVVDGSGADRAPRLIGPIKTVTGRRVTLERRLDGEEQRAANATYLLKRIAAGGCACWVCNTVAEAQACYRELKKQVDALPLAERPILDLFHARFLYRHRREIETRVVGRFGPDGDRPKRAILVATQTVEQSLDVDFDVMVTQLAPIDLLLQRSGRLHRHLFRSRPEALENATLIILDPTRTATGRIDFGDTRYVYEPWVLLKTLLTLTGRDAIDVPAEVRELVERTYDDLNPTSAQATGIGVTLAAFDEAWKLFDKGQAEERQQAQVHLLKEPDAQGRFAANQPLEWDDGDEAEAFATGQTRLSDPSVRVVLVEKDDPLVKIVMSSRGSPSPEVRIALVENSVSITNRTLVNHLRGEDGRPDVFDLAIIKGFKGYYLICLTTGRYSWKMDGRQHGLDLSGEFGVTVNARKGRTSLNVGD